MWPAQFQGVSIPSRVLMGSPNSVDPGLWSPNHFGNRVELAPGEERQLTTIEDRALYQRWRLCFRAERTSAVPHLQSYPLIWTVTVSTESGIIVREIITTDGSAQACYATGRSLTISVRNPSLTETIVGFYALDIGDTSSGEAQWPTGELLPAVGAVEVQLSVPPFAHTLTLQTDGAANPIVKGYDATGLLCYSETFSAGLGTARTVTIRLNPLLTYTVSSSGVAWNGAALYDCRG